MARVVDLRTLRVARTTRFVRAPANASPAIGPNAAASPVEGTIAFTLGASTWTLHGGAVTRHPDAAGPVAGVAFTPTGRLIALVGRGLVPVP
jgi:hypothetical protein